MLRFIYFLYIIFWLGSLQTHSAVYQYHPSSRLYLGGGFNPYKPDQGSIRCIIHDGVEQVDTASDGAVHSEAIFRMVKSRKELYDAVGFSASISGGFLFVSGEGSVQLENESSFQSDSLSWLLLFRSDYGRSILKNPRFDPSFSNTSDDILYDKCGSEIVTEVRKGVMAYALFTVNNLTESQKSKLNTKFSASFGNGIWNASTQADYKSFMSTIAAVSNVSIMVNAIGGQGVTSLASLLDDAGNADFFSKYNRAPIVLANYIKGMNQSRAVPIQFVTMHIKSFVPTLGNQFADFKTRQVAELFNWYQDISSSVGRLREILIGRDRTEYSLSHRQTEDLRSQLNDYTTAMNGIYEAAGFCFVPTEGAKCKLPSSILLRPINWPKRIDNGKCQQLREFALSSGLIEDNEEYQMALERNFAPHLVVSSDMRVSMDGWHRCEDLLSSWLPD